jgi:4-amino-4-deoxychorismate lyase
MEAKPLLIETIRIQNGRVRYIKYHNRRCNISRQKLFGSKHLIDLRNVINSKALLGPEVKCRITYDDKIRKVEYEPYLLKPIQTLQFIEIGKYECSFKYKDREKLKDFYNQRGDKDDVLMTKNGYVCDTYYANVALQKNGNWYTPKEPLLQGTNRARLLEKEMISEASIHIDQLVEYNAITIFNAMIPFKKIIIRL